MYESHVTTLQNTQFNVENVHIQTQMMRDNVDIMRTLKETNDVQKTMMKDMKVDDVYDLMDEMRDVQEDQQEFQEALQRNYEIDVGDDELDAELDELDYQMQIELDAKDLTVPNRRIESKKEKDEKELEKMMK